LPPVSCLHPSYPYRVKVSSTSDSPADSKESYWHNEGSYTVYGDIGDTITVIVQIRDTENSLSKPVSTEIEVNGELRKFWYFFNWLSKIMYSVVLFQVLALQPQLQTNNF